MTEKKDIKNSKKRVVMAMSGGVDSSVAAALLKEQGYDVVGIFMKLWAEKTDPTDLVRENICCSVEASTAARAVAEHLSIPFYVVNFEKEFKKAVVDYYVEEYESGRTPNPCVICNRDIKGELLMRKATELGADYLATGHYAQIEKSEIRPFDKLRAGISKSEILRQRLSSSLSDEAQASESMTGQANREKSEIQKKETEKYKLMKAVDEKKDQTYFLWTLTQEKLGHILFPVGGYTKPDIRKMALKLKLPTATRRESQGICFIPDRNVAGFLRRYAQNLTEPGPIIDLDGKQLGTHDGLINFTIGQRERLGLGGPDAYYVIRLDSRANTLVVGRDAELFQKSLVATNINWINQPKTTNIGARIRYGHPIDKCIIEADGFDLKVTFAKPQRAITPGQSIVFYQGDEVLGGGIIK